MRINISVPEPSNNTSPGHYLCNLLLFSNTNLMTTRLWAQS